MSHLHSQQVFPTSFPLYIKEVMQDAISEHSHEFFEMVYVRGGRGQHFIEGERYPIQAGDLYVISPGEKHGYAPLDGQTLHIVNILWMPSLVEDALRAASRDSKKKAREETALSGARQLLYVEPMLRRETHFAHRLHLSGRTAYRVDLLIDEIRHEQAQAAAGHELLLRHLFCALLVLLSRAYDEQNERASMHGPRPKALSHGEKVVARAIDYIEANYNRPLRVRDVAAHVAISESRLAHIFKENTRRGINEYLHEFRVARACTALLESDQPIGEIAAELGYADSRFFYRTFRRHIGCSPSQYKQHFAQQTAPRGGELEYLAA